MNKFRKLFSSKAGTALLAAGALILLTGGSVNGARAALTYYSDDYVARVSMENTGVTLIENGERLSWRDYSNKSDGSWDEGMGTLALATADPDGTVKIGKEYREELSVRNTGDIDGYVRVIVHKYWANENGARRQDLDPAYILLKGLGGDGWIVDEKASTEERTVLYYSKLLPAGSGTAPFLSAVAADPDLADLAVETEAKNGKYTHVTTSFDYNGTWMGLDIEADIVQEHNITDAAWSAWGRRVYVSGGNLGLR